MNNSPRGTPPPVQAAGADGPGEPPRHDGLQGPAAAEAPRDRRSLLEVTIQALPVGVVVHDSRGRCILANATALQLDSPYATDRPVPDLADSANQDGGPFVAQVGERVVESRTRALRSEHEAYSLTTLVDITQHHGVQRDLLRRAYFDSLTGLPNRALVEQHVEDLIASSEPGDAFALAFIDLDNFKNINDYYSHAAGDALLTKVANRILGQLRPTDMLARVGGDEFVLLLTPAADPESARSFVADIAERLKEPFFIDGHEIFASASIGVSMFPAQGASYDVLRRKADGAMYRVKGNVKGGVGVFEDTMDQAATERMAAEQRLRLAIRDRRFCCAYQPKVEMRTGKVHGVEVLLRWQDDKGLIQGPGKLIELAVELGLINDITLQVLADTVRCFDEIEEIFGPDISISINVAAKQACDVAFMTAFVDALAATGRAERFMIELTEEAFFTKSRFQAEILPRIRAVGARVSIDDFGVGYSSLAALAEITADEIKIDRTFITDIHERPRSQVVLKAIESLGQALGMSIIAEGVESFEEVAYLQAATQIRYAQGYYFARPMLIDQLRAAASKPSIGRDSAMPRQPPQTRRHQAVRQTFGPGR